MALNPIMAIHTDLVNAVSSVISSSLVFPGGRPSVAESDKPMSKFLVIELPAAIKDYAFGNKKFMLTTTGVFYLYSKAKSNGTLNLNAMSDFVSSIEDLFPINGDYCSATSPRILMNGADRHGYQVVTISFDLQTKAYIFEQNS